MFDNGLYGETGMQASHTGGGVDSLDVARGCGIERVIEVEDEAGLKELAGLIGTCDRTLFARVRITPDDPPRVLPKRTASRSRIASAARRWASFEQVSNSNEYQGALAGCVSDELEARGPRPQ